MSQTLAPGEISPLHAPPARGELRVSTTFSDGSIVAHVPIRLSALSDRRICPEEALTDDEGVYLFGGLTPGRWMLDSDLGGHVECTVNSERLAEARLVVPFGEDLSGAVLDRDRRAITGAELWLSKFADRTSRTTIAVTDERGQFHIPNIGEACCIGARARGYAPSATSFVTDIDRSNCIMFLNWNGRSIEGDVVSPEGYPVTDAFVVMTSLGMGLDGEGAHVVNVDPQGLFSFLSVHSGRVIVSATAPGRMVWSQELSEADTVAHLHVVLEMGCIISGVARSTDGRPMQGVAVYAAEQWGILRASVLSSSDGAYRLSGLSRGKVRVRADGGERGRDDYSGFCLGPGGQLQWDPILGGGARIGGSVLDETGQGMPGITVIATSATDGRMARTNDAGQFMILNCQEDSYRIEARDVHNITIGAVSAIKAGQTDVVISISARKASIFGKLVDERGAPVAHATVLGSAASRSMSVPSVTSDEGGLFAIQQLAEGTYHLYVDKDSFVIEVIPPISLLSAENRDLGVITLREGGRVSIACYSSSERLVDVVLETEDGTRVGYQAATINAKSEPFRFERVPLQALRVRVLEGSKELGRQTITPIRGQETSLAFRLE